MIFNTLSYFFAFLLPAAIAFRVIEPRWRPFVCIGAGSLFFVYFSLSEFGGVLGSLCLLMFIWEAIFSRLYRPGSAFCWIGVGQALVFLGVFKYWNFLTGLVHFHEVNPWRWHGVFLPLGISFFTFEFIHYAVDRYKGRAEAGRLSEYLAFILFFPTMVAGPIKRYQDFLPNLREPSTDIELDWSRGITRILVGLAKKCVLADTLTALTSHLNHDDIATAPRWLLLVWIIAYGVHIYIDFSSYSDIAIGSARLFGLKVKENFDWPYLRTNIADFWASWHMTLYRWLVDYVFIPLGGSRVMPARVYINVLVTMLVSGLWHGAGLNFIAWGAWHGVLLCFHRAWRQLRGDQPQGAFGAGSLAAWLVTFISVNLGWAFFCMNIHTALFFFTRLLFGPIHH